MCLYIQIKGKFVLLGDHLIEVIESMSEEEKAETRANLERKLVTAQQSIGECSTQEAIQ